MLFLTSYAYRRCLKELVLRLGMDELLADGLVQLHAQQSVLAVQWSNFITNNCVGCSKSPDSCDFMNPKPENCLEGVSPQHVKAGNALAIEAGKFKKCPSYRP
jgi:hypothetical protein